MLKKKKKLFYLPLDLRVRHCRASLHRIHPKLRQMANKTGSPSVHQE